MVAGARNALELARLGRLGEDYAAPYEVVDQGEHHRLRRYATCDRDDAPVALFVPPLMVTSEVYDVAPDVSAVATLGARGIQPFVVDFGAPEHQEGGMHRTLDDHVRAVLRSIDRARELTGRDVIVKANLARVEGARALATLIDLGCLRMRASAADEALRIKRLCAALNLTMAALDDAGFGVGAQVREYFDSPPPAFEEALANLSLDQPIDEGDAVEQSKFIAGGQQAMIMALEAVLDDALLQAADTLPELLTQKVRERVKALGA